MADWSMNELQDWDKKICALGEGLGLDWYPIDYEICDYKEMIGHMIIIIHDSVCLSFNFDSIFDIS